MSQKRIRSSNWDEEEKRLFCSILRNYSHIIENKSLNTNTNKAKNKAWNEVHKSFNEINCRPRELSQLQIQWKAMKLSARKTHSSFKKAASKTGGGTRPPTPDNITTEIKDLLNPAEFLKDHNIFDSDGYDAILSTSENEKLNAEDICVPGPSQGRDIFIIETVDEQFDTADTEHTPLLELPTVNTSNPTIQPNKCMITPNKAFYNSSTKKRKCSAANITISKKDTDYKTAIINHSKGLKDEEHRRRMEMAEEEHQLKIKILQETLQCSKIEKEILHLKKEYQIKLLRGE